LELEQTRDPKPLFAAGKPEGLNGDEDLFRFGIWNLHFGSAQCPVNFEI